MKTPGKSSLNISRVKKATAIGLPTFCILFIIIVATNQDSHRLNIDYLIWKRGYAPHLNKFSGYPLYLDRFSGFVLHDRNRKFIEGKSKQEVEKMARDEERVMGSTRALACRMRRPRLIPALWPFGFQIHLHRDIGRTSQRRRFSTRASKTTREGACAPIKLQIVPDQGAIEIFRIDEGLTDGEAVRGQAGRVLEARLPKALQGPAGIGLSEFAGWPESV